MSNFDAIKHLDPGGWDAMRDFEKPQSTIGEVIAFETFYKNLPEWGRFVGTKFYTIEELSEFDVFNVVNGDKNADLFKAYYEQDTLRDGLGLQVVVAPPPLDRGVMKVHIKREYYLRWKVLDRDEGYYKATVDVYTAEPYRFVMRFVFNTDDLDEFVNNPKYEDGVFFANKLLKSKLPKSGKDVIRNIEFIWNKEMQDLYCVALLRFFFTGMHLFSDLLKDDSEKIPVESERVSVKTRFKKDSKGRRRVIYLNGVSVECAREDSGVAVRRGVMVRTCAAWGVRGHYRHYQNGKTAYIAPYEKGRERNQGKAKGKEYKVR